MDPFSNTPLTPLLLKLIAEIDEFKGRWASLGNLPPERLQALKRIATIASVGSSTRIEGVKLDDEEIERLLSNLDIRSFRSRDEEEVAGYADLMELIFDSFADIPISENTICQLHGILLKYSRKDERHRGHYKILSNSVEAFDAEGRSIGIIFETATPFETPRLMNALLSETHEAFAGDRIHPLLIIAVFVVRFLAIHPFQDGNGRLSRALTTLMLLQCGYDYVPYSSLERVVEDSKEAYYVALRRAQATLDGDGSRLINWIDFFVQALHRQKEALEKTLGQERLLAPLAPLSEKILGVVREHGRVTVRDAVRVTLESRNTIKDHLGKLVATGALIRRGRGRGTWYERA